MDLAVVQNNVELIRLLISYGVSIYGEKYAVSYLYRAAEFGADRVGPVIIGGNLKAKKVDTYYNDYALEVKQTLQADTLIIDDHQVIANHFDVKERIEK